MENTSIPPMYFRLHLTILLYLGIDIIPIKNRLALTVFRLYSLLIISLMCSYTVLEGMDMVLNFETFNKLTFALCYFVTHILGTSKMFLMVAIRRKLWHHFEALENGVFAPDLKRGGPEELELVRRAIKHCKRQGTCFYTFVFIIIGARTVYAALANLPYDEHTHRDVLTNLTVPDPKTMPYTTWMPFDYNPSPGYEAVFAFQIFCTVVYGYYIGAADALICGFMMLIKAQFLIIQRSLATLLERAGGQQRQLKRLANAAIAHHTDLINICQLAEGDFCYLMLLQFLSSLLILCFQLYQLSTLSPGSVEFFSMSMYLVLMVFQLLCYCWHGNEVALVSGEVASAVYNINWLVMGEPVKKTLLLMMMRSQRPHYFTAGKFSILNLVTFMTIMRGAASYFMFLKQMSAD